MSLILDVRYTDLEKERMLCQELLEWSKKNNDPYSQAFASAYLGDYWLAVCNEEEAGKYLLAAMGLLEENQGWTFLQLQIYRFLGIYHDIRMDEQGSINCYLKAISVAEQLEDVLSEIIILNNLATTFDRHHCYREALEYYLKAYELQAPLENIPFRPNLLINLVDIYLQLGQYEEAKQYAQACQQAEKQQGDLNTLSNMAWCSYYATIGEKEQVHFYAQQLLEHQKTATQDKFSSFDSYYFLCEKMLNLGEKQYCQEFLHILKESSGTGSLERMKRFENLKTRCIIQFGTEEECDKAYYQFYLHNQRFRIQGMSITSEAMKSKIHLEELLLQTTKMRSDHQNLEQQVLLDELTAIHNRRFMENMMREHTTGADGCTLNIIILDVDYFKEYNDYYGHMQGDMVLKEIANCLDALKSENIYPCRFGGDEFACLCKGVSAQKTEAYICAIRNFLQAKAIPHEKSFCSTIVTLSIGYVLETEGAHTEAHQLFQLADQALYESKRAGRNTYTRSRASLL